METPSYLQTLIETIVSKYNQKILSYYQRICLLNSWGYENDSEIKELYSIIEKLETQREEELKPYVGFMLSQLNSYLNL